MLENDRPLGFGLPMKREWSIASATVSRNPGTREARGKIILFGDDDIIPSPRLVEEHVIWHQKRPDPSVAVLGLVEWAPEVRPTPFMEWLAKDGVLFAYGHLRPGESADFRYFYSCNLSLKTAFVRENGMFDEDFKGYGFEDTELGYRLQKRGLRLVYNPAAVGYHHKFVSFADACRRASAVAAARRVFESKEAGQYLAGLEPSPQRPLLQRVKHLISKLLTPFLGVLVRPLLESYIPLPRFAYRKIHYHFFELNAERLVKHLSLNE